MTTASKVYLNDAGTELILDTLCDLTAATVHNILAQKPGSSTVYTWTGTVYDTTKIKYVILAGDLNVVGDYYVQASVTTPTWSGKGESASFHVYPAFG